MCSNELAYEFHLSCLLLSEKSKKCLRSLTSTLTSTKTINRIDLNFGKYAFLLQITLENMQKCTYKPLENMHHTS